MPVPETEIEALWAAIFGEPPSIKADVSLLVRVLVSSLPPPPPYSLGSPVPEAREAEPEG